MFFFPGLRLFGVPLSMVRIVGGINLVRIGFDLFSPSASGNSMITVAGGSGPADGIAFVPLAMPIMFGPGAIATILGMTSLMEKSANEVVHLAALAAAIVATMGVTYVTLPMPGD